MNGTVNNTTNETNSMNSFSFLSSPSAFAGRLARRASFVVWAELPSGKVVELDADDSAHAVRLADCWIANVGAVSASTRKVAANGSTKCVRTFSPDVNWD
jgi:hypothetical protein